MTAAPRSAIDAVTSVYRFPPATPLAPAAEQCTDEDLLRLAVESAYNHDDLLALISSPAHVRVLCLYIERLEAERRLAQDQMEVLRGIGMGLRERLAWVTSQHQIVSGENLGLRRAAENRFDRSEMNHG